MLRDISAMKLPSRLGGIPGSKLFSSSTGYLLAGIAYSQWQFPMASSTCFSPKLFQATANLGTSTTDVTALTTAIQGSDN